MINDLRQLQIDTAFLSNHKMAEEFKKNNKNKSSKKDTHKETNAPSFAQVKSKCLACSAKGHGFLDSKKQESTPCDNWDISKKKSEKGLQECMSKRIL